MKLAIIGSRSIQNSAYVFGCIEDWKKRYQPTNLVILAGGADGVDDWAERWAKVNSVDFVLFKPYFMIDNQSPYSSRHFFMRNKQLVLNADHVLAIWDGKSNGTNFGIKYAKKVHKPITIFQP